MTQTHPELACGVGDWDAEAYGNHRITVLAPDGAAPGGAVTADVPWRRRDADPRQAGLAVVSAASGRRVRNVVRLEVTRARGRIAFEPVDGPGEYHVHYLPHAQLGSAWYPQASYRPWRDTARPEWRAAHFRFGGEGEDAADALPVATAVRYEAATAHDSFAPMGFTATPDEVRALEEAAGGGPVVLAEDRTRPVETVRHLPAAWAGRTPGGAFAGTARRGEAYAFQVAVWNPAPEAALAASPELRFPWPAFTPNPDAAVPGRRLAVFWVVVPVPADADPGEHRGSVTVAGTTVDVRLEVVAETVEDGGAGEPELMTRLGWLAPAERRGGDGPVAPYTPVRIDGDTLGILGRTVTLGADGLPAAVATAFSADLSSTDGPERQLLAGPVELTGRALRLAAAPAPTPDDDPAGGGSAVWRAESAADGTDVRATLDARLDPDGCLRLDYRLAHTGAPGSAPAELPDGVVLTVPLRRAAARYAMGLGLTGQPAPAEHAWTWKTAEHNQDAVWVGDVPAGVQVQLRGGNYRRPLNTNYYRERPLNEPESWGNGGRGDVRLRADGDRYLIEARSGALTLTAGEPGPLFTVRLLLTPFKPVDHGRQLRERYFHGTAPAAEVAEFGATVANVHHATVPAPFINDPLLTADRLRAHADEAHAAGLRLKIYNTVRELTTRSPEIHALRSLGGTAIAPGPGGGHIWLQEHLGEDYVPGWHAPNVDDVAVVTTGEDGGPLAGFYVRAVERLARECGIDGLYLDDVAFERDTLRRTRAALQRHRPDPLIDLHSANQCNPKDGWASSTNLYLELLPYVDRLWLGEYVDYDGTDPAYWLVEVSGLAFGLTGEMLEGGGNPWRGMLFGMTGRAPRIDPRPLWRFWDEHGLPDARMRGWWVEGAAPVRTGRDDVLCTTWLDAADGSAVVAVASWAGEPAEVTLTFDADALGFAPVGVESPAIEGFQDAVELKPGGTFTVDPTKGRLLVLRSR
ncbi:hypothetical protein BIV57_15220 [Mangrovactinospora gilvigrisea]|uniref:Glycoside hydrolase 123-like N-terminal domain-containing protein n=1 Tax=Mangrovactinospora gilvigrisea TaxID=1428644 RepID=A0A1J7BT57_9ACTN|nr:glycoside hydrolase domain-containing protein [Mangrovactinospora gilvigrisea]OIV36649.1 hypothetical protein BIV57_15220 [Mangrovactinospora gilvigrisea]